MVGIEGDSFFAVFPTARGAALAAVRPSGVWRNEWPHDVSVRVRMGLHTGTATPCPTATSGWMSTGLPVSPPPGTADRSCSAATAELVQDALPDGVTLTYLGTHALRDVPQPERLCQLSIDGLETEFPAIRAVGVGTGNLPAPLTTFVGREELAALTARVVSRPLVTLVGSGGTGKSRLAIEVGRAVDAEFSDGVWFIPLADVSDPAGRRHGGADARDRRGSSRPMAERLIDHRGGGSCSSWTTASTWPGPAPSSCRPSFPAHLGSGSWPPAASRSVWAVRSWVPVGPLRLPHRRCDGNRR